MAAMTRMPRPKGTWSKGGLRYTRLRSKVTAAFPDVTKWFIATSASADKQEAMFDQRRNEAAVLGNLFAKENVVAVSATQVAVFPVKGPGIFGMGLGEPTVRSLADVACAFDPAVPQIIVDGQRLHIFMGHEYDALQTIARCGASMPDWFQSESP